MKIICLKKCRDCPYLSAGDVALCMHPACAYEPIEKEELDDFPVWCPLECAPTDSKLFIKARGWKAKDSDLPGQVIGNRTLYNDSTATVYIGDDE